jgi:hypothetical protein
MGGNSRVAAQFAKNAAPEVAAAGEDAHATGDVKCKLRRHELPP